MDSNNLPSENAEPIETISLLGSESGEDSITEIPVEEDPSEENVPDEDPLAPSLYNQELDTLAKVMVISVVRYMKIHRLPKERAKGEDFDVDEEAAKATGVSVTTVKKVISEYYDGSLKAALKQKLIHPPKKIGPKFQKKKT